MSKKTLKITKCSRCRKKEALPKSIRDARVDDIEDGRYLSIEKNICEDCLEETAEAAYAIINGG